MAADSSRWELTPVNFTLVERGNRTPLSNSALSGTIEDLSLTVSTPPAPVRTADSILRPARFSRRGQLHERQIGRSLKAADSPDVLLGVFDVRRQRVEK